MLLATICKEDLLGFSWVGLRELSVLLAGGCCISGCCMLFSFICNVELLGASCVGLLAVAGMTMGIALAVAIKFCGRGVSSIPLVLTMALKYRSGRVSSVLLVLTVVITF